MMPVTTTLGDSPIVLAMPHGGTFVPDDIAARLNAGGLGLSDTDWHIDKLYEGLLSGATIVQAQFHRYVIDANRGPDGASLYPGQNTTGLCPTTDFDGNDIWREGQAPSADEVEARRLAYHAPYHAALAEALAKTQARHGVAVLYDCHSIRSYIPYLFEGELPVFSIGTNNGASCDAQVEAATVQICRAAPSLNMVLNGRFKGGWTTRHYGQPETGVHAIQMEIAQRAYLAAEAAPWAYSTHVAAPLRAALAKILASLDSLARSGAMPKVIGA
jgi:N-formylglutamate deformylase